MEEMLQTQDSVEVNPFSVSQTQQKKTFVFLFFVCQIQAEESLNGLQEHLTTLGHFHEQFVSYRMAFNKLILEIARRRQYREAAEDIVRGMVRQLDSMTEGGFLFCLYSWILFFRLIPFHRKRGKPCQDALQR